MKRSVQDQKNQEPCGDAGDWQKRGPGINEFNFYGGKGEAKQGEGWMEMKVYLDQQGHKFEEDGYLFQDAGPMEGFETTRNGQGIILDMMKRSIDTNGQHQRDSTIHPPAAEVGYSQSPRV